MGKKLFILISVLIAMFIGLGTWAATYSDFTSGDMTLSRSAVETKDYVPFIQYRTFNFGHANLNEGSGVTDTDVIKLFNVLKDTIIEEIGIRVTTASVYSGVSGEIGDGNDIDGFVGNDTVASGVPFVDLSNTYNGVSCWSVLPYPIANFSSDGGSSRYMVSGVSFTVVGGGTGATSYASGTLASNAGPYLTSGLSPFVTDDTIDLTVYTGSNAHGNKAGVTPVFEAYIKGFKRITN